MTDTGGRNPEYLLRSFNVTVENHMYIVDSRTVEVPGVDIGPPHMMLDHSDAMERPTTCQCLHTRICREAALGLGNPSGGSKVYEIP